MPKFTVSATGQVSAPGVAPGTYHSTSIVLPDEAREGTSIRVDTATAEVLKAGKPGCIWTDSLQICYPIVFKFSNGDLGLYHGNGTTIKTPGLADLYNRPDLVEIQLFEKGNNRVNTERVEMVARALMQHFQNKAHQPAINIQVAADRSPYGAVVCYHGANGKPVVIVGNSGSSNSMASSIDEEGVAQQDVIKPYHFESAQSRYAPPQAAVAAATAVPPNTVSAASDQGITQTQMKKALTDMKASAAAAKQQQPQQPKSGPGGTTIM